jgi:hypothetical protein
MIYLLRKDSIGDNGMLRHDVPSVTAAVEIPGMAPGCYEIICFDTRNAKEVATVRACVKPGSGLQFATPAIEADMAFACRRLLAN